MVDILHWCYSICYLGDSNSQITEVKELLLNYFWCSSILLQVSGAHLAFQNLFSFRFICNKVGRFKTGGSGQSFLRLSELGDKNCITRIELHFIFDTKFFFIFRCFSGHIYFRVDAE